MSNFQEYPIYKKRDGQSFNEVSYIYADSFEAAKKEFALNMTKDNWEKSNNIVWLEKGKDDVDTTGWWDLNYDPKELFCSEESIKEGFESWSEDVYTWEIREIKEFEISQDGEFFENYKGENLEDAEKNFPKEDGFTIIEK
jgi:hypothetical protein